MATSIEFENVSGALEGASAAGTVQLAQAEGVSPQQPAAQADPVPVDAGSGQPVQAQPSAAAPAQAQAQYVADASNVVHLPASVSIDNIKVDGDNLVLEQADGSVIVIKDAAANVPTFLLGDVEVPRVALIAALEAGGINVAFGADGSISAAGGSASSSGGNFELPAGGIGDGFDLSALLPPTALAFPEYDGREQTLGENADPEFAGFSIRLSEEGLGGGIQDDQGDPDDKSNSASYSGFFGATDPNGDALTYSLGLPTTPGLTSGGQPITWELVGPNLLVGKIDGGEGPDQEIIRLEITNPGTGAFEVTIMGPIDHPVNSVEDVIGFDVPVTVKDPNGGSATANVTIEVEDDSPDFKDGNASTGVDEDDLRSLWSRGTSPDGDTEFFTGAAKATGSLSQVVQFGADGPAAAGAFEFTATAAADMAELGLQSKGIELTYVVVGNTLFAYADEGAVGQIGLEDRLVFTMTVDADSGDFTFRLLDQLDHVAPESGADEKMALKATNGSINAIDFGSVIKATDGDGDSVTLDGKVNITVRDDIPEIALKATGASVVHDETAGLQQGNQGDDTDKSGVIARFASLGQLPVIGYAHQNKVIDYSVKQGADDSAKVSLVLAINGGDGTDSDLKTTDGREISLFLEGGLIVGRVDNAGVADKNGQIAFAVAIDPQGGVSIAQYLSLQHPDKGDGENGTHDEPVNLGNYVNVVLTVTDNDGDTVEKSVTIGDKIAFEDDGPKLVADAKEIKVVNEDDIDSSWSQGTSPHGQNEADGQPQDDDSYTKNGAAFVSGTLAGLVTGGADQPLTFEFKAGMVENFVQLYSKETAAGDGLKLTYTTSSSGDWVVFTATEPDAPGTPFRDTSNPVFELRLNTKTGAYEFRLFDELVHKAGGDENFELRLPNGQTIDHLPFGDWIIAKDGDGDWVSLGSSFQIEVRDDVPQPVISANSGVIVTHDETPGTQWTNGADDVLSIGLPWSAAAQFTALENAGQTGDDLDVNLVSVLSGKQVIGYATSDGSVVNIGQSTIGADSPAASAVLTLELKATGTPSGLYTTEGQAILLYKTASGLVVGRIGGENGTIAFAIAIGQDGKVSVAQYLSIRHDDQGDFNEHNDNGTNGNDAAPVENSAPVQEMIVAGAIKAVYTITDSDGDTRSDDVDISGQIRFLDDGPKVDVSADGHNDYRDIRLTLDETNPGGSPNDNVGSGQWSLTTDPNAAVAIGQVSTPTSNSGTSVAELFDVDVNAGSDGLKTLTRDFDLVLKDASGTALANGSVTGVQTNMVVTAAGGTALAGMPAGDRTIWLYKVSDTVIIGKIGQGTPGNTSDDYIALRIELTPGADPQLKVTQFLPVSHPNTGEEDEGLSLLLKAAKASLGISQTVTVTDKDGDTATDSHTITVIGGNKSIVEIQDDAPRLQSAVANATNVTLDEGNTDAGVIGSSAPAAIELPVGYTAGEDLHVAGTGVIASAASSGALVTVTGAVGTDGPNAGDGISYALKVTNAVSGVKLTDGTDVTLVQVSSTLVLGVVNGNKVAFAVSMDADTGAVTVEQYLSLWHDNMASYDEPTSLANGSLSVIATITDGDGDKKSSSPVNVGSHIVFEDDGPKVTGVVPSATALGNELVVNGSFEAGHGLTGSNWEIYAQITGWTSDGAPFEIQTGGAGGLGAEGQGNAIVELDGDTQNNGNSGAAAPNPDNTNATIQQTLPGTEAGQTYQLSFAYSPRGGDGADSSGMQVWFDGKLVYEIPANNDYAANEWQHFTINVTASGPNAVLAFKGTGSPNELGALLDSVSLKAVYGANLDDEDALGQVLGNQGGPGDDGSGSVAKGKIVFDAGSDGLKSIVASGVAGLKAIYVDPTTNVGTQHDVTNQVWVANGAGGTLTGTIDVNGTSVTVYTLTIDAFGNYTLTMLQPLVHSVTDNPDTSEQETSFEDNRPLDFGFTITDGDGDTATGNIVVNVDDDSPEFVDGGIEDGAVSALNAAVTGDLNLAFGEDGQHATNGLRITGWPELEGITTSLSPDGKTLTATIGGQNGPTLYTLQLNGDGTYTFNQVNSLPGGGNTLPAVSVSGGFGPTATKDFGSFLIEGMSGNLSGSGTGIGVSDNNMDAGDKFAIVYDMEMTSAELGVNHHGNGKMSLAWVAYDANGVEVDSGNSDSFDVDGKIKIDSDVPFVRIEITTVKDTGQNPHFKLTSVGGETHGDALIEKLNFQVAGKDGDGDSVSDAFDIKLGGSKPVAGDVSAAVDDDGLPSANGAAGSAGDIDANTGESAPIDPSEAVFHGNLQGTGGDGTLVFSFAGMHNQPGQVGQEAVTYTWHDGTSTLTATGPRGALFTVQITDTATGAYKVTLLDNVLHTAGDNSEESVFASLNYTVGDTDADTSTGDTDTGELKIEFNDDVPRAVDDTTKSVAENASGTIGGNLLANDVLGADGAVLTHVQLPGYASPVAITSLTQIEPGVYSVTVPLAGTYTFKADGSWTLDPAPNPSLSDKNASFGYIITDGDGDTSRGEQPIWVTNTDKPLEQVGTFTGIVEEEHLNSPQAKGIDDLTSSPDGDNDPTTPDGDDDVAGNLAVTTDVANGNLSSLVSGIDGTPTFAFSVTDGAIATLVGGANLASQGQDVRLDVQDNTMWGYADNGGSTNSYDPGSDRPVFRLDLDPATGEIKFTLLDNIDHHSIAGADNAEGILALDLSGKLKVTDSANNETLTYQNVSVKIIDDVPVAANDTATVVEGAKPSMNVVLVIDTSGSMAEDGDPNTAGIQSRLAMAKAAALNLLNSSGVTINQVMVVEFYDQVQVNNPKWGNWSNPTDRADIEDFINSRVTGGGTNYDAATGAVRANWGTGPTDADLTNVYFLSDGDPDPNDAGLDTGETTVWQNFLVNPDGNGTSNDAVDNVYAVGIGSGVSTTALDPVAWANGNANFPPIVITDATQLSSTLTGTLPGSTTGNVLSNDGGFGADGGRILSIEVDGVTYTWNGANSIAKSSGGTITGTSFTVNTTTGGTFTFQFATGGGKNAGDWSYKAPASVTQDRVEHFTYVVRDGDGDTVSANLDITVQNINQAPAGIDGVISGTEDTTVTLTTGNFSFTDGDNNQLQSVIITTLPAGGQLLLNGAAVVAGATISATDIAAGQLTYVPAANANGSVNLKFQVVDNGSTAANGSQNTDASPNTLTINLAAVNDAPTIGSMGETLDYTENDSAVRIDTGVTVSDIDSTNFNGGSLTVAFTANGTSADLLSVLANGNGGTRIAVNGNSLRYGGTNSGSEIGTISGGANGQPLVIAFNSNNATQAAIERVLESIAFANSSDNPSISPRTVSFTLVDGDGTAMGGADTAVATATVNLTAVDDAPVANSDRVYTNAGANGTTVIPEWALLFNDADPDSSLDITGWSNLNSLNTVSLLTKPGSVTVVDNNNSSGGSFIYTVTAGGQVDTATVTLVVDTSNALDGNDSNNILVDTNAANSTLNGKDGNDILIGNVGDDILNGGDDDDVLVGGAGSDTLDGGDGIDTASYIDSAVSVRINLNNDGDAITDTASTTPSDGQVGGNAFGDNLYNIENLIGGSAGDYLAGNSSVNVLSGLDGNDQLFGEGGNDFLYGGAGDDRLDGGSGSDTMVGGAGNDVFVISADALGASIDDLIADYSAGDVVDLTDVFATFSSSYRPDNATEAEALVSLVNDGVNTSVMVDNNGLAAGGSMVSVATLSGVHTTITVLYDDNQPTAPVT